MQRAVLNIDHHSVEREKRGLFRNVTKILTEEDCVCVCVCVGYMDKYWETKRELETLRQRLSTERDDELETLQTSKRSLEKKVSVWACMSVRVQVGGERNIDRHYVCRWGERGI